MEFAGHAIRPGDLDVFLRLIKEVVLGIFELVIASLLRGYSLRPTNWSLLFMETSMVFDTFVPSDASFITILTTWLSLRATKESPNDSSSQVLAHTSMFLDSPRLHELIQPVADSLFS
jgi:hypothetical protein